MYRYILFFTCEGGAVPSMFLDVDYLDIKRAVIQGIDKVENEWKNGKVISVRINSIYENNGSMSILKCEDTVWQDGQFNESAISRML